MFSDNDLERDRLALEEFCSQIGTPECTPASDAPSAQVLKQYRDIREGNIEKLKRNVEQTIGERQAGVQ